MNALPMKYERNGTNSPRHEYPGAIMMIRSRHHHHHHRYHLFVCKKERCKWTKTTNR